MQSGSCTHLAGKHFKTGKAESAGLLRVRLELLEFHFFEIVLDKANYIQEGGKIDSTPYGEE